MASTLDLITHKFAMRKGHPVHVATVPYVRLSKRNEDKSVDVLYIQNGQFFTGENTPPIKAKDLPEWAMAEIAKLSPEAKREVGLEK